MASSLSNLVNNLAKGIYKIKSKYEHGNKKWKKFEIKHNKCESYLEYRNFEDLILYKFLVCKRKKKKAKKRLMKF